MGLVRDFFLGPQASGALEERALEVTDIGLAFDAAITQATGGTGSRLPAVYRSTQFITDTVASLHMVQVDASGLIDSDTPSLLAAPNPAESYHETLNKVMASLLMRGNAYLRPITRDQTGNITSVHVLDPDEVTVQWDRSKVHPVYAWRDRNMVRDRDIIHIPINLWPGEVVGKGPIEAARLMLSGAEAEQRFQRTLFEDNATPTGLIMVHDKTQAEVDKIQATIDEKAASGRRLPRVISNAEWKQLTINPADAEFLEARNFTVQDIGRLFGLHGLWLNVEAGSSLTYSTTESLFRLFITATLRPTYLERIEQAFARMLPRAKSARFNTDELLRADIEARYRSHEIGLRMGFLTINEVRREEGLPPLPGGDEPLPMSPSSNGSATPKDLVPSP